MRFPSDARPWRRDVDGYFSVRRMLPRKDVATASEALCHQWRAVERGWLESEMAAAQFGFAAECPIRFFLGEEGGNRFLCPTLCGVIRMRR